MIGLKMLNGKWRIKIEDEELQFDKMEDFNSILNQLIKVKNDYGNWKDFKEREK